MALPQGALFWPARRALLVADLHLEKGSWFARLGQMLPPYDSMATLSDLTALAVSTGARRSGASATASTTATAAIACPA
jgi:metallophosphoesterase superfamily enzyme